MKRNYIILLAALLTVACAGNGDTMSPTPQEGEILFSGSTVGPKVRTCLLYTSELPTKA